MPNTPKIRKAKSKTRKAKSKKTPPEIKPAPEGYPHTFSGVMVKGENVVGICHNKTHRGYIGKGLLAAHGCVKKQCSFFEKLNPEYWEAIDARYAAARAEREERDQRNRMLAERNAFVREVLADNKHIYVTLIREENGVMTISYIRDMEVNLTEQARQIEEMLGCSVVFTPVATNDRAIEELIRVPRRKSGKVTDLLCIPGVGEITKQRLQAIGVMCMEDLLGRDPMQLFETSAAKSGERLNEKILGTYKNAIEYAAKQALLTSVPFLP
ncbi:MAG: helix-hairpin-helix domain-containing protein [Oscillospiraceae bacterium]|nr:helix-hairpin-helix domain-containing protein [Oscillospiraceae bacterium]